MSLELTHKNFDQEVTQAKTPVLVDFWAPWCGPCRAMGPTIDELAREYDGRVKIAKVNVDNDGELASRYGVMSIPTLAFFKDGQLIKIQVGAMPKQALAQQIEAHLGVRP